MRAEVLGARHRHRHLAGSAAAHLRELHAGRPVDHAALRRHGPGHHHRQAARRADGRAHRPGERGRAGQHLLVRDRARQAARARARRRGRARRRARAAGGLSRPAQAQPVAQSLEAWGAVPVRAATLEEGGRPHRRRHRARQALPQRAALLGARRRAARAALPPRGAGPGAAAGARRAARGRGAALRRALGRLRRGARAALRQAPAVQRAALDLLGRRGARRRGAAAGLRQARPGRAAPVGAGGRRQPDQPRSARQDPGARRARRRRWSPTATWRSTPWKPATSTSCCSTATCPG